MNPEKVLDRVQDAPTVVTPRKLDERTLVVAVFMVLGVVLVVACLGWLTRRAPLSMPVPPMPSSSSITEGLDYCNELRSYGQVRGRPCLIFGWILFVAALLLVSFGSLLGVHLESRGRLVFRFTGPILSAVGIACATLSLYLLSVSDAAFMLVADTRKGFAAEETSERVKFCMDAHNGYIARVVAANAIPRSAASQLLDHKPYEHPGPESEVTKYELTTKAQADVDSASADRERAIALEEKLRTTANQLAEVQNELAKEAQSEEDAKKLRAQLAKAQSSLKVAKTRARGQRRRADEELAKAEAEKLSLSIESKEAELAAKQAKRNLLERERAAEAEKNELQNQITSLTESLTEAQEARKTAEKTATQALEEAKQAEAQAQADTVKQDAKSTEGDGGDTGG